MQNSPYSTLPLELHAFSFVDFVHPSHDNIMGSEFKNKQGIAASLIPVSPIIFLPSSPEVRQNAGTAA